LFVKNCPWFRRQGQFLFNLKKENIMASIINIVLFGIGNAGSALINKVVKSRDNLAAHQPEIRFPVITNSSVAFFEKDGDGYAWEANFIQFAVPFKINDVIEYVLEHNLHNLIAVDATPSAAIAAEYPDLVRTGFSIVSINESLQYLPENFEKGIHFLTGTRGLGYKFINSVPGDAVAAGDALYAGVLEVAGKTKEAAV
jgi:Homoserine dehydrogenase, NAD binding domain